MYNNDANTLKERLNFEIKRREMIYTNKIKFDPLRMLEYNMPLDEKEE